MSKHLEQHYTVEAEWFAAGVEDVDQLLAGLDERVKVPAERLAEFLSSSDLDLEQQVQLLAQVEADVGKVLELMMSDPGQGRALFLEVDPRAYSRDHGWRDLLFALFHSKSAPREFLTVALGKYMEYLQFRRELLEFIKNRRNQTRALGSGDALLGTPRETNAFGRPANLLPSMASDQYVRLTRDRPVSVTLPAGEVLVVVMASHPFQVSRAGNDLQIVDERGLTYKQAPGRISLGRHARNDVVVNTDYQEISRIHLFMEWDGKERLILTDSSTLGTFLQPGSVDPSQFGR